jgi:hypothetical protein
MPPFTNTAVVLGVQEACRFHVDRIFVLRFAMKQAT